jgi:hypothetical protein
VPPSDLLCWEALDPADPALGVARRLYETTQAADERIPWRWIAGAVAGRAQRRPGGWSPHLLLAAPRLPEGTEGPPCGFAYGAYIAGYAGYACYLGVEQGQRRRGAGARLLDVLRRLFQVDAACVGAPLPFVIWESRRPARDAPAEEREQWRARVRLFERVGAHWAAGLTLWTPNLARRDGPPVPLQLFLVPGDVPAAAFDAAALRDAAAGLLREVYGREDDDPLLRRTLPPDCRPELRPAADAEDSGDRSSL